jgi:Flp pilus assembly pilin Flp
MLMPVDVEVTHAIGVIAKASALEAPTLQASRHRPADSGEKAAARGALAAQAAWSIEPGKFACNGRRNMKAIKNLLVSVAKDEQGGEVLEYALIAGLIVVAAIAIIGAVGTKVLARWTSLNNSI